MVQLQPIVISRNRYINDLVNSESSSGHPSEKPWSFSCGHHLLSPLSRTHGHALFCISVLI